MASTRFPMSSYPRGWYVVGYSSELSDKEVMALKYFGQELVLFRGEGGAASLMDAYCSHLGTHLGIGGSVEGDCIRCPMHGWLFNAEGECAEVPYAKGLPNNSRVQTWPLIERSGLLWTHYPPEVEPEYEPPVIEEFDQPEWTHFSDERNRWKLRTHAQMIQENACDIQHLRELHRFPAPVVESVNIDGPILTSAFQHVRAYSEVGLDEGIEVKTRIAIYGLGLSKQNSTAAGIVESTSLCTTTPIDEELVELRMASALKRLDDADATQAVHDTLIETTRQTIEEDIPIWESRSYRYTNYFALDQPLSAFRRWAEQFYGEE